MTAALRRARPWLLLGGAVLVVALLPAPQRDGGPPLDPRSNGPLGARALVLVLEELGADVELAAGPGPGTDAALLLSDHLDDASRARLLDWVRAGGTLVVADPRSELAPLVERSGDELLGPADGDDRGLRPQCDLPVLAKVGRIDLRGAVAFRPPPGAVACFPFGDGFALVARRESRRRAGRCPALPELEPRRRGQQRAGREPARPDRRGRRRLPRTAAPGEW
jgi:hypothetical protein